MTDPAAPTSPLPASIGRFQIVRKLGAGGMGDVYEGFDAAVSRYAAVKILRRTMLENSEVAEHFVLEAQRIAKLESHPNIPTVYEVGVHDGLPFLAMQKIDGGSLATLLRKRGVASLALLRSVASGIGSALAFAHDRSIVHCDVKPQNVLVDRAGKPYLTDFGISRARPDPLGGNESPLQGLTPYYASPEQSRGAVADARSDVYSFGILLYEMCTGVNPWLHVEADELAETLATHKPARADARNRHVPKALADALEVALDADPMRRPAAVELARLVLRSTDAAARWTVARQVELGIEVEGAAAPGIGVARTRHPHRGRAAVAAAVALSIAATIWVRDVGAEAVGQERTDAPVAANPARTALVEPHDRSTDQTTTPPTGADASDGSPGSEAGADATRTTPKFAEEHPLTSKPGTTTAIPTEGSNEQPAPAPVVDAIDANDADPEPPAPAEIAPTPSPAVTIPQGRAIDAAETARRSAERIREQMLRSKEREATNGRLAVEIIGGIFQSMPWLIGRGIPETPAAARTEDSQPPEFPEQTGQAAESTQPPPPAKAKPDPGAAIPELPGRTGLSPGIPFRGRRDRR